MPSRRFWAAAMLRRLEMTSSNWLPTTGSYWAHENILFDCDIKLFLKSKRHFWEYHYSFSTSTSSHPPPATPAWKSSSFSSICRPRRMTTKYDRAALEPTERIAPNIEPPFRNRSTMIQLKANHKDAAKWMTISSPMERALGIADLNESLSILLRVSSDSDVFPRKVWGLLFFRK